MRLKNIFSIIFLFAFFMMSCKNDGVKTTSSGLQYVFFRSGNAAKPKVGDYMVYELLVKNSEGKILFDSRANRVPIRIKLTPPSFAGSFEEGLAMMSVGDSAAFFVSSDSINKMLPEISESKNQSDELKKGTRVRYDVVLLGVQTSADAEAQIDLSLMNQKSSQDSLFQLSVERDFNASQKSKEGYYLKIISGDNKEPLIQLTDTVFMEYVVKAPDGKLYESSYDGGNTLRFIVGSNEVIPGLNLAALQLRKNQKALLLLPSNLGYAEEGVRNQKGTFKIPPHAALLFELLVVDVKKAKRSV